MPYLSGTLRPKGLLLTNYSVLSEATTPNGIATLSGQPPNKATEGECPAYTAFPSSAALSKTTGVVSPAKAASTRSKPHPRRPARSRRGSPGSAYMEGMKSPTTGEPENCVYPGAEERRGGRTRRLLGAARSVRPLPLAARRRRMRRRRRADHRTEEGPEGRKEDAELLLHLPRPLLGGRHRAVPGRRADGGRGGRRLARRSGAGDPRIARLQEGRPADHQLRRRQPARAGASKAKWRRRRRRTR